MVLENAGIRGIDLVDEAMDCFSAHAEDFFDEVHVNPGENDEKDGPSVFVLPPYEYAIVEPRRHKVGYLGTGMLDLGIGVFICCPRTGRFGATTCWTKNSCGQAISKIADSVSILSDFALENGASKLFGYDDKQKRRIAFYRCFLLVISAFYVDMEG